MQPLRATQPAYGGKNAALSAERSVPPPNPCAPPPSPSQVLPNSDEKGHAETVLATHSYGVRILIHVIRAPPKISISRVGAALALVLPLWNFFSIGRDLDCNLRIEVLRVTRRNKPNIGCTGLGFLLPTFADTVGDDVL
ncbi:hypothetical protein B0H14DRAFT_3453970 [Mycena olivaceomarginata]|nr:hypothetical protein B0H14DRAFT_3453970 [Mycena olivaceomarginata]